MTRVLRRYARPVLTALAALAALALPAIASAQDTGELDARMCRNGLFAAYGPFQLARISGEGRAYFLHDRDGCPEAADCRSLGQPYVVAGDTVIVSRLRMGHACAFFPNAVGGTAGYLPLERLEFIETGAPTGDNGWFGSWSGVGSSDIAIGMSREGPRVAGTAFWQGLPTADGHAVIHDGEINGPITFFGNRARFDEGLCIVDFTLLGDYLLASDNGRCGGMNVRFIGVYLRDPD
ncbi:hypothetical protein [Aurantiacibacter gilvus]|uniref:Uncharacterized protein n=1 Tax=Aurantiacibacter gilvus TaxID=3139141 RepID=A0ABU9IIP4_9SPHN